MVQCVLYSIDGHDLAGIPSVELRPLVKKVFCAVCCRFLGGGGGGVGGGGGGGGGNLHLPFRLSFFVCLWGCDCAPAPLSPPPLPSCFQALVGLK
jgi:hypothetical protein